MPANALEGPMISQYPDIPATRDEDLVISRSKRPKLGGQVSAITLHPDGSYTVTGPDWEVTPEQAKMTRAQALSVARVGPSALEEQAEESAEESSDKK